MISSITLENMNLKINLHIEKLKKDKYLLSDIFGFFTYKFNLNFIFLEVFEDIITPFIYIYFYHQIYYLI